MSLPVSQYEALLAEVRGLRRKAQRVQQLATPLISNCSSDVNPDPPMQQNDDLRFRSSCYKMESLLAGRLHNASSSNCDGAATSSAEGDTTCSEDECGGARSTHLSVSSEPISHRDRGVSMLYHGTWPVERTMWNSEPTPNRSSAPVHNNHMQEVTSVMSFASSSGGVPLDRVLGSPSLSRRSSQQLEAKVDMVYSLLAMLSGQEHADMGETLLALSTNPESCLAMRQSGCIPLLVQMVQSDREAETRKKASQALHNLVHSQPDEKLRKREIRIFKLLEHTRAYTEALRTNKEFELDITSSSSEDDDRHPVQTVAHIMKLSFDELHRQAICTLGGIHTIASLVEAEHVNHGSTADEAHCILMRRYACMALTNLTFGDSGNKALLCSFREFMRALVIQLQSPSDELRQVTASVLRNLSWRADSSSKEILREVGSVTGLMKSAMLDNKENTLKSILSALWNLSAHCTENKSEICSVEGALGFLVDMLTYKTPSKSLAIIENSGGILRNISSQIAVRDDYREILRQHNCLQILLDQLKSPSLTIVSNACGTLWNLSAKCAIDQEALWQMGAPTMLRSLNHSKHKMIAMGSSAALKNLLSARPSQTVLPVMDSTALAMDLPVLPTLGARKQKALLQDLDQTLSETYENIDKDSPVKLPKDDKHIPTNEFIQKNQKNKYNRQSNDSSPEFKYGELVFDSHTNTDFSSLNVNEPSTSFDSKFSLSLPYVETPKHNTAIPVRSPVTEGPSNDLNKKCFVKNKPKNIAKNVSSASETDNKNINTCADTSHEQSLESPLRFDDEGPHHSTNTSSSNSIDNDKCKKLEQKLKEVSMYSDEKDHCSIEDISDSDNQSSLGLFHEDSSYLTCGFIGRKEISHTSINLTSSLPLPNLKYPHLVSSNVTMFEGDINEINVEDISIHFPPEIEEPRNIDENNEKQDVEKEKKTNLHEVVEVREDEQNITDFIGISMDNQNQRHNQISDEKSVVSSKPKTFSGIPLPRSSPKLIPSSSSSAGYRTDSSTDGLDFSSFDIATKNNDVSVKKNGKSGIGRFTSGLPRRSLQTSTPIRIKSNENGNMRRNVKSSETYKVHNNIDTCKKDDISLPDCLVEHDDTPQIASSPLDGCSLPVAVSYSDASASVVKEENLNISQENNIIEIEPKDEIDSPEIREESKIEDDLPGELVEIPELSPTDSEKSKDMNEETNKYFDSNPECPYLNPESCVNFTIKDDRDRLLERSCEESNLVDNRMLDPDAMIESLDRFTAELVSQASHLQSKDDDKYKDNTWNDDTSPNELTFPSISGDAPNVITFESNDSELSEPVKELDPEPEPELEPEPEPEQQSNDFSSINTSTMTESTLIAIEATKMATVFKNEAEMSHSTSSITSLELDRIQPPSFMESLTNSGAGSDIIKSPKLTSRKKSLPRGLMVRRALSNSLNNGSSLESLENNSLSNLDQMNPPSAMADVLDMEGSITSVASLPSENAEIKTDFVINAPVNKNNHFLFNPKSNHMMNLLTNNNSISDLENINPPSLFNEITDLCNSLADVPTEAIGSETEIFEDCYTHVLQTEDDVTEFSDANSATPIQSDLGSSSPEVSPKKNKTLGKPMTSKQRRNLTRDRYKTYTVAAEMVMKEEDKQNSYSEDFKTDQCSSENYKSILESQTLCESPTYSVQSPKMTPKERRQNDRARFETRVVEEAITDILQQPVIGETIDESTASTPAGSPARTKLSIRRNFMQKRLENKDRFKTQTLTEASFSPELSVSPEMDLHLLVQKEANLVLKSLRETKTSTDELLDCETLSLVSNDDDSEHNSASSINYRTYHKSWGLKKNVPVIETPSVPTNSENVIEQDAVCRSESSNEEEDINEDQKIPGKPKIVKPSENKPQQEQVVEEEPQGKGIRGRRKPLYARANIGNKVAPKTLKPIKTMTSNLVKNVTSSIKSVKQTNKNVTSKPPVSQSRVSSGYGTKSNSPKTSPARTTSKSKPNSLERQGTFTKDETVTTKSRIPTPGSATKIPTKASKIPSKTATNGNSSKPMIPRSINSASSDRVNRNFKTNYGRSTSADSRETTSAGRKIQNSVSSQSLKNEKVHGGTVKRSSIPHPAQKTGSNSSLNSSGTNAKKQVTSKIASIWKKIEETKNKQPVKKDTRIWIQNQGRETTGQLIRSNTFDNKDGVILRSRTQENDSEKRVSRLGSFIVMDDTEDSMRLQQIINAAATD